MTLPSDPALEQRVLAAMLLRPELIGDLTATAIEDDWHDHRRRAIVRALVKLHRDGQPIEAITVERELRATNEWNSASTAVAELLAGDHSSHNARRHATALHALGDQRRFAIRCTDLADAAREHHDDPQGWVERAADRLAEVSRSRRVEIASMPTMLHAMMHGAVDRTLSPRASVDFPWPDVRVLTGPLRGKQVVVIAARPGVGKSAAMLDTLRHVAGGGGRALAFSLEMDAGELLERAVSAEGKVHADAWDYPDKMRANLDEIVRAADRLSRAKLDIIDDCYDVDQIVSMARSWRRDRGRFPTGDEPAIIAIDYVQLCETRGRHDNRAAAVSEISRKVKRLAKELDTPILLLAQLNRDVDKRSDHRPLLSDLKESGAIEQDADKVAFLHRQDFYDDKAPEGVCEVIVRKNRRGRRGVCKLDFVGHLCTFVDHERRYEGTP